MVEVLSIGKKTFKSLILGAKSQIVLIVYVLVNNEIKVNFDNALINPSKKGAHVF